MEHADKFSNKMDLEEATVACFKILSEYLPEGTEENNGISVRIAGLSVCVQQGWSFIYIYIYIYINIYLFIYFICKWVFTRWQWYYNKTQHTNNTHPTK
jgi:hypothetical protein